jgi:hypothetical protein
MNPYFVTTGPLFGCLVIDIGDEMSYEVVVAYCPFCGKSKNEILVE